MRIPVRPRIIVLLVRVSCPCAHSQLMRKQRVHIYVLRVRLSDMRVALSVALRANVVRLGLVGRII